MRRLWICRRLAQGLSERAGPVSHGSGWQRSEGSGCRDYGSATRLQDGHSSTGRRRLPPSGFRDSQGQQSTRVGRVIGVGKRIMKLNPRDRTNKRFQEPGTQERGNVGAEGALSKNAQFRAIQVKQELLDHIEQEKLGRRRSTELRRSGYDLTVRAPIDTEFASNLFTHKLVFAAAAKQASSLPQLNLPEVAFLGRSNVGKSSLLNALTRRWGVAWTSDKPGFTQSINFFTLKSKLCLVDLPGYGFAFAKEEVKTAWEELVKHYLVSRKELRRVCLLVDAKWGLKPADVRILELLESAGTRVQIVLTKTDTVAPIDIGRRATQIQEALKDYRVLVQPMMMVSSETGGGIGTLRASLAGLALQA